MSQQQSLQDLQRRYRLEENKKKQLVEASKTELRRQAGIIDRLSRENDALRDRIADQTHTAAGAAARDQEKSAKLLLDKKSELEQRITQEKDQITQLEKKIKDAENSIQQLRKARAEAERARPTAQAVEHKISLLENALELTSTKYNDILAQNGDLRTLIQHLRTEHLQFEKTHSSLIAEQEEKQAKMAELMDLARQQFQLREQLQDEIQQLEEQAKKEETKFRDDWNELNKIIEKDAKRRAVQQQQAEQQKHQLSDLNGLRTVTQEENNKNDGDAYTEGDYEKAFRQIIECGCYNDIPELRDVTPETQLSEQIIVQIINRFLENEEKNFSLFNYANDLRSEVEQKEEELFKLREELKQAKKRKLEADSGLKTEISALEIQLQQVKQSGTIFEQKYEKLTHSMSSVYELVEQVFKIAKCDPITGVSEEGSQFINSENVILHLSAIEGVVDQMIGKLLNMIKNKQLGEETIQKYIINRQDDEFVQNLAPASAAIIQLLNKEDDLFAE